MASPANIMKLLSVLGGGASESYGQGSGNFQKVGGQPILPKPTMSMPHNLSPYAPGNQAGGPMAHLGALQGGANAMDSSGPHVQPNSTNGAKEPKMRESGNHPAQQLAQYLAMYGHTPKIKSKGVDAAAFLRGSDGS